MNRQRRRAKGGWLCQLCHQRRGYGRARYCMKCVERTREEHRCGDCDSVVTVMIAEDTVGLWLDLRHDATCPSWRAKNAQGLVTRAQTHDTGKEHSHAQNARPEQARTEEPPNTVLGAPPNLRTPPISTDRRHHQTRGAIRCTQMNLGPPALVS